MDNSVRSENAWGTMGGSAGDGIAASDLVNIGLDDGPSQQQQFQQQYNPTMAGSVTTPGTTWGQPQYAQPSLLNQPPQPGYPAMNQQQQTPSGGSITRFATGDMMPSPPAAAPGTIVTGMPTVVTTTTTNTGGSYAERSARAHASQQAQQPYVGVTPTSQQQPSMYGQQQQGMMTTPPRIIHQQQQSPSTPLSAGGASTYAARSAATQQATPGYGGATPTTTGGVMPSSSSSYAARSAAAQQQHFAQASGGAPSYAARSAAAYGGGGGMTSPTTPQYAATTPPRPSQPSPVHPQTQNVPPQAMFAGVQQQNQQAFQPQVNNSAAPTATGSYAARSAQAYGQQQQPTTGPSNNSNMTYAQRSMQAQQQQNHQQQLFMGAPQQQAVTGLGQQQPQPQAGVGQQPQQLGQMPQQQQPYAPGQQPNQDQFMSSGASVASTLTNATSLASTVTQQQQQQQQQQRHLTDATRKVQEHAYYMKQAMQSDNLPVVLDRASYMVGELGGPPHGQHSAAHAAQLASGAGGGPSNTGVSAKLTPKNYYELYMRALEDIPSFEEYLMNLVVKNGQHGAPGLGGQPPLNTIQIIDTSHQAQAGDPSRPTYTMLELYNCTQYCPRVLSRLYLQITAGSALIKSGEAGPKWVMEDLASCVKSEQNPIRGLFLRHYLLTALRDKLPDTPVGTHAAAAAAVTTEAAAANDAAPAETATNPSATLDALLQDGTTPQALQQHAQVAAQQAPAQPAMPIASDESGILAKGNVRDSYEFILENFEEMNKLWVRLSHLPGEVHSKEIRRRRERERNDLKLLVGTNLVRLSQMECVTSQIYGEHILPRILNQLVTNGDPLSQAYVMDCLVQVFPDEYHMETLGVLLNVCPKLRDKVNIRTILSGLMDRLTVYLQEEEMLDGEHDTNQVKQVLGSDSFRMFHECILRVYESRGPKLQSREAIRLQTALLEFSTKCYPDNMEHKKTCLSACVDALKQSQSTTMEALQQAMNNPYGQQQAPPPGPAPLKPLDEISVGELQKLLQIPLDTLGMKVLELEHYQELLAFLPPQSQRQIAKTLLEAMVKLESSPATLGFVRELFGVVTTVLGGSKPIIASAPPAPQATPQHAPPTNADMARTNELMASLGVGGGANPSTEWNAQPLQQSQQQQQAPIPNHASPPPPQVFPLDAAELSAACVVISKLIHLLRHEDTDVWYQMLCVAKGSLTVPACMSRQSSPLIACVFAAVKLARRILTGDVTPTNGAPTAAADYGQPAEVEKATEDTAVTDGNGDEGNAAGEADANGETEGSAKEGGAESQPVEAVAEATARPKQPDEPPPEPPTDAVDPKKVIKTTSCRQVFVYIQESISVLSRAVPQLAVKLYLEMAISADSFAGRTSDSGEDFGPIAFELINQAFSVYEDTVDINDTVAQERSIKLMVGTLLACTCLSKNDYEALITKTAQFSAKVLKKPEQCRLVALCAHLFYPTEGDSDAGRYQNAQRALECLQRSLKLADACTVANPANIELFVDLFSHYIWMFEKKNPSIAHNYITGLAALIQEHFKNHSNVFGNDALARAVADAKAQFSELVRYIQRKKVEAASADMFAPINIAL